MMHLRYRPHLEVLEDRNLLSTALGLGAMGDSLTAPYWRLGYSLSGDHSWAEQLQILRGNLLTIADVAVPGETSASLLARGQEAVVAGRVPAAVLLIGANDVLHHLAEIRAGNSGPLIAQLMADIQTTLGDVYAAGSHELVLGNVPDLVAMPGLRPWLPDAASVQKAASAVTQANQQIEAWAAARHIPVVDLHGIFGLTTQPLVLGTVAVSDVYAMDNVHPSSVIQGLIADAVLKALEVGYHVPTDAMRLSDQDLLNEAGLAHGPAQTYFNVSRFVIYHDERVAAATSAPVRPIALPTASALLGSATAGASLPSNPQIPPAPVESESAALLSSHTATDEGIVLSENAAAGRNVRAGGGAFFSPASRSVVAHPPLEGLFGSDALILESRLLEASAL
jgi:lysophospholipase L1-like esterase